MYKAEAKKVLQEAYQYLSEIDVKGSAVFSMANAMARIEGLFGALDNLEDELPAELPQPTTEEE